MIEGWLLDVHENEANTGMVAWVVDRHGVAHRVRRSLETHPSRPRNP